MSAQEIAAQFGGTLERKSSSEFCATMVGQEAQEENHLTFFFDKLNGAKAFEKKVKMVLVNTVEKHDLAQLAYRKQIVPRYEEYLGIKDADGFVPFNKFRELGQNQYVSRYASDQHIGKGLRWKNLGSGNYHDLMIHIDDLATFHERVCEHRDGRKF